MSITEIPADVTVLEVFVGVMAFLLYAVAAAFCWLVLITAPYAIFAVAMRWGLHLPVPEWWPEFRRATRPDQSTPPPAEKAP